MAKSNDKARKEKERNERWIFKVPNTPEGQAFLKQLTAYRNKARLKFNKMARGKRAKHAIADGKWARSYDTSLPVRHAEWFHVYVDDRQYNDAFSKLWRSENKYKELNKIYMDYVQRSGEMTSQLRKERNELLETVTRVREEKQNLKNIQEAQMAMMQSKHNQEMSAIKVETNLLRKNNADLIDRLQRIVRIAVEGGG